MTDLLLALTALVLVVLGVLWGRRARPRRVDPAPHQTTEDDLLEDMLLHDEVTPDEEHDVGAPP
jgi:hypothetical protein